MFMFVAMRSFVAMRRLAITALVSFCRTENEDKKSSAVNQDMFSVWQLKKGQGDNFEI